MIWKLKFRPQKSILVASNFISAELYYEQWTEALGTMVQLWDMKLNDKELGFSPRLVWNVEAPSDRLELNDRLKVLFIDKLKGLKEGELMEKWLKKLGTVVDEITKVSELLKNPQKLGVIDQILMKRKGLEAERDLILNRVEEFKNGIRSIEVYLENGEKNEEPDFEVFRFVGRKIDWGRIYRLMMRECRRFDDGLPVYAHRRAIMKQIHCQQVYFLFLTLTLQVLIYWSCHKT